jgi:Rhs element Vgr protein
MTAMTNGGIVTFTIKVDGKLISDHINVQSIIMNNGINRIPTATIIILDGDASTGKFEESSSSTFLPGAEVIIETGYDSHNQQIFRGIITKQRIKVDNIVGSTLEVECKDEAIKMTVGKKSLTFQNKKDSEILTSIIGNYSGLTSNVADTNAIESTQIQYNTTDWDYIISKAETNGLVVIPIDGKVSIQRPDYDTSSVLTLSYGDNLLGFDGELNAITQLNNVTAHSWDYSKQSVISGEAQNTITGAGNLSSSKLSEVIGLDCYQLQTSANLNTPELTEWAKAEMIKSELSKITGTAKCQGSSSVVSGKYITLGGLGDRFNGDHIISEVNHTIAHGDWTTEISIGMTSQPARETSKVSTLSEGGFLPKVNGLFNGTVKKIADDPINQYRILVDVPLFDQSGEGVWARFSNFYSTSGAGAFFMPEVGDEVVLGFLSEDPRYPIILGSLYSNGVNKPHNGLNINDKNSIKAIVSKSGISLEFDDENKILSICTPNKNTVVLNDNDQRITLEDQHSNSIVMSSSGITIKSSKDLNLEADQNINIKGTTGIKVAASGGDVETTGMNVKMNADAQFSAKGSATAEVQGGAELTLKGAMVMIN